MASYTTEELYYKLDNMILSSCTHLREVFKIRWKEETQSDWLDDKFHKEKLMKNLIPTHSKFKKLKLKVFQQKALKEKLLADWDMSLLSDILLLQSAEKETRKNENDAIRKLKDIRNKLAHNDIGNSPSVEEGHTFRHCTQSEYEIFSGAVKESLFNLGMEEQEIDKLIELSGVTSSLKALERAKNLYAEAEAQIKEKCFDKAIIIYTDALDTPSLLPEHRGEAFEKRAECYLKHSSETGNDFIDKVLLDVEKALELNRSSWLANYLAGQCYRKKYDFLEALHYLGLAMSGTPAPKTVKREMNCCKILAGMNCYEECMSPLKISMSLDKQFAHLEKETGVQMITGELKQFFAEIRKVIPGQDHVLRGHVHFVGWNVPQNFTEAIQYYAKADRLQNLEGTFNLGKCYHFGCGVEEDVEKAMQIYQKVAYTDRNYIGQLTTLKCNIGVAYSQYSIGTMYAEGTGVIKNLREAAAWYKKAMDNGVGHAANELGNLYANGKGVPLDEEMAESCWLKALDLKDLNAAASLVAYYIRKHKPDKARDMMKIGRALGNEDLINIRDDELCAVIN